MTAASRVSDSRVTDEMVEIVGSALYIYWSEVNEQAKDAYRKKVRAALEAAIACQGPVAPVDALQGLCDEWENMKVPLSANSYDLGEFDGYRGARRDLDALIAKANGHE